jgi:hypothetical protein
MGDPLVSRHSLQGQRGGNTLSDSSEDEANAVEPSELTVDDDKEDVDDDIALVRALRPPLSPSPLHRLVLRRCYPRAACRAVLGEPGSTKRAVAPCACCVSVRSWVPERCAARLAQRCTLCSSVRRCCLLQAFHEKTLEERVRIHKLITGVNSSLLTPLSEEELQASAALRCAGELLTPLPPPASNRAARHRRDEAAPLLCGRGAVQSGRHGRRVLLSRGGVALRACACAPAPACPAPTANADDRALRRVCAPCSCAPPARSSIWCRRPSSANCR